MIPGYLATKTKEVIYLKDPQLFDPTRPTRKNPYWEEKREFDFEQNHIYFKYNFSTARAIQSVRKYKEKWKIILHTILHRYVLGKSGQKSGSFVVQSGNFFFYLAEFSSNISCYLVVLRFRHHRNLRNIENIRYCTVKLIPRILKITKFQTYF